MTGFCIFALLAVGVIIIIGNILLSRPANDTDRELAGIWVVVFGVVTHLIFLCCVRFL